MHKGDWQLELWNDGQVILGLSNAHSADRAGELYRGIGKDRYEVWCPEGIFSYNVFGRSATDGHDQERKKMALADGRRVLRDTLKAGLFDIDVLLTNFSIAWRVLEPDLKKAEKRTKVRCLDTWAQGVLTEAKPLRRRIDPRLAAIRAKQASPLPQIARPPTPATAAASTQPEVVHVLRNTSKATAACGSKNKGGTSGSCPCGEGRSTNLR